MTTEEIKKSTMAELVRELDFYFYEMGRMGRDPQALIKGAREIHGEILSRKILGDASIEAEKEKLERKIRATVSDYQYKKSIETKPV